MRRRTVVLSLSATVLLAPAPANAATLTLDKPCYRVAEDAEYLVPGRVRVGFTGTGFKPGIKVLVDPGITDEEEFRASPTGTITGAFRPTGGSNATPVPFTVTAKQDDDEPFVSATASSLVVGFGIETDFRKLYDRQSKPTIRASGFYGGKVLYAHVNGGKYHRLLRIGTLAGPCGQLVAKGGPFIKRRYPGGHYRIQFDTSRKFTRRTRPKYLSDQTIAKFPFGGYR
jgi:hypothetical protein